MSKMKALLVADPHFNLPWFEWIEKEAAAVDAVFIVGDLLDMIRSDLPLSMQAVGVRHWLRQLAKKRRAAFCSGNHDKHVLIDRAFPAPNLISDGFTEVMESFVITSVPYWCDEREKAKFLDRGRAYRAGRKWIVLHHVPPSLRSELIGEEVDALKLIHHYHPDYFLCGHLHNFPRLTGGVRHRIERTVVLNPGQALGNLIPNHLIFDFTSDAIVKEHAPASSLEADFDFRCPPENSRRL